MGNEYKQLKEIIKKQNDFILGMFNDKRIPDKVKEDYFIKYNELKINCQQMITKNIKLKGEMFCGK